MNSHMSNLPISSVEVNESVIPSYVFDHERQAVTVYLKVNELMFGTNVKGMLHLMK